MEVSNVTKVLKYWSVKPRTNFISSDKFVESILAIVIAIRVPTYLNERYRLDLISGFQKSILLVINMDRFSQRHRLFPDST